MTKEYTIYEDVSPGPVLLELTSKLIEPIRSIESVRFTAWRDDMGNKIGAFIPKKKEVIIDLGNVLNNADLYRLGMMHVPAAFFTALWAIFHEITHGRQLDDYPELADMDEWPSDYETAAQMATKDQILTWVKENTLPALSKWGWMGEMLTGMINDQYSKGDLVLLDELDALHLGAVADVESVLAIYEFKHPQWLTEEITQGNIGLRHKGRYYLKAIDFFGLDQTREEKARVAQTVSMG